MLDLINVGLRMLMCTLFILVVVRPMIMALVRREPDYTSIEEMAQTATNVAFGAWNQDKFKHYYDNPELALFMANNPDITLPDPSQPLPEPTAEETAAAQQAAAEGTAGAVAEAGAEAAGVEAAASDGAVAQAAAPGEAADATDATASVPTVEGGDEAAAQEVAQATDEVEVTPGESLDEMRKRMKQEKKKAKPTVPPELLENANSYEDKLMVVRMIVDQERSRVASVIRRMIKVE